MFLSQGRPRKAFKSTPGTIFDAWGSWGAGVPRALGLEDPRGLAPGAVGPWNPGAGSQSPREKWDLCLRRSIIGGFVWNSGKDP